MAYLLSLRYVKLIAYRSAKTLQLARQEKHSRKYVYYYGFQVIYGMINKILILLLASSLLNITKAVLAVSIVFAALRVWAGGFHFKNYTVCAYFTVVTLLITGWLVTVLPYNTLVSNIILSTLFVTITLYAPVENSNHPIREQDKNKHKQFALFTILILFWLKSCINDTLIQQAAIGGSLLATITALPIINKFVERGRKNVIVGVKNQV